MKKTKLHFLILAFALLFLGAKFGESLKGPIEKETPPQSSSVCKECHREIHAAWKNSLHAIAVDDPMFMASYMEAHLESAGEAKFLCLRCHAPLTRLNNDFDLKQEITREGVSCDFCHSIKAVFLDKEGDPFVLDKTGTKIGPLSNTASPAHKTMATPIFKLSQFCGGCHQYTNNYGVTILGTYSEWENSPYPQKNVHCQNCHMPLTDGNVVEPQVKEGSQKKINLHAISAAHSNEQLQRAVKLEVRKIEKDSNFIYVEVALTNVGSGHFVPTGIPSRKLILSAEVRTPNEYYVHQRVYQRILKDKEGKNVEKIHGFFTQSTDVELDTRLRPFEPRLESFVFALPKSNKITVTLKLEYLFVANVLTPTELRIKMADISKELR